VGRADWDEQRHVLILSGLTPAAPAHTMLHLARDWDLPAVAAERISWTSVIEQRISLNGQPGPAWSSGVSPAGRGSGGWSSPIAGSIPGTLWSGPS